MIRRCLLIALLVTTAAGAQPVGPVGRPERPSQRSQAVPSDRVDAAMSRGTRYLLKQIQDSGQVADEYQATNPRFGGRTALAVYALLRAGADPEDEPALARAIAWTRQAKLWGTYAVGFRAAAMGELKDDAATDLLSRDAAWLVQAASDNGAYSYTSAGGQAITDYDNSNAHIAAFGVWTAASRGIDVPLEYWQQTSRHWLSEQQDNGGWGYRQRPGPEGPTAQAYGSMTAAGVATLAVCRDFLGRQAYIRCKPAPHAEEMARGLAWLEKRFSPQLNPGKGVEWYYYWLFCVQRVGGLTGRRNLGDSDWYADGVRQLLRRQHTDGSWGYGPRVESTAFAMLFLAQGRAPRLLSKVRTPGRWNARPHDAANLVRWLSYTYERPLGWQVIDLDAELGDWDDARILYISGAGPVLMSDRQVARLRQFVLRGGLILSEAADNNGDFTMDMHRIYQRMFPEYRMEQIERNDPQHPIYTLQFANTRPKGLYAVSNGVRPLAIHAPQQLSLAMELGPGRRQRAEFNLMANLYLYLTEMGAAAPRGQATWEDAAPQPTGRTARPMRKARLARLRHKGNWNPEPLAFRQLTRMLADEQNIELTLSEPLAPSELRDKNWPIAHITGTGKLELSEADIAALRAYLADGGKLIAEAAGGSPEFARAMLATAGDLLDKGRLLDVPQSSPLYREGPYDLRAVAYRRGAFETRPIDARQPRLQAIYVEHLPRIILSLEDISGGLVGYPLYGMRGYRPTSARRLMANLVLHFQPTSEAEATAGTVDLDADADTAVEAMPRP
jgi:hypothetical protein